MNLPDRRKDIWLTMQCKIINELTNVPYKEILIYADTRTRSKQGHTFHIITNNLNEYKYAFFPWTISQYNCLLNTLIDIETVDAFKHGLKDLNSSP